MNATEAREQRAKRLAQRRVDERACALDFLTWGDEQGIHEKRCVHRGTDVPVCSRTYNPGPEPDEKLYEGTGIGALFGFARAERHAWQLAGWNVTRRKGDA